MHRTKINFHENFIVLNPLSLGVPLHTVCPDFRSRNDLYCHSKILVESTSKVAVRVVLLENPYFWPEEVLQSILKFKNTTMPNFECR